MKNLAQQFGYFQTRGVSAEKTGSISQLVEAIAQGKLTLRKPVLDFLKFDGDQNIYWVTESNQT